MLELVKNSLVGQFHASLYMLSQCVQMCPADVWLDRVGNHAFWHVAYHTLFCVDVYLSADEASFRPRSFHRENYEFLGALPVPPYEPVVANEPYEKDVIAQYVQTCKQKASEAVAAETADLLAGPSGFPWVPMPRLELHVYNIRHVQHHAAQMSLCLRRSTGSGVEWTGTAWPGE